MINLSLDNGEFSSNWKVLQLSSAQEPGLEPNYVNSRPVSNLQYIVESAAAEQISQHLHANLLLSATQSAYKCCHSTEIALLRIKSDLLIAVDQQKVTLLVLLDSSATFDTLDHNVLLHTTSNPLWYWHIYPILD